jgi:hypothetical protein
MRPNFQAQVDYSSFFMRRAQIWALLFQQRRKHELLISPSRASEPYFFKAKQFYSQKSAAEGLPDNIIYGPNHDLKLRICQSTNFISSGRNFVHTFLKIFQRKKKQRPQRRFFGIARKYARQMPKR